MFQALPLIQYINTI